MSAHGPTCRHCGLTADEHHAFEGYRVPPGCVCEPQDWGNPHAIPPVCDARPCVVDGDELCVTCQHLVECHGPGGHP